MVGLDTSGDLGSVAVLLEGPPPVSVSRSFSPGRRHSINLLPALAEALKEAGIERDGNILLAVARGPGSFTGLRVGLATVQGLALATGAPAMGVSSLDAAADADAAGPGSGPRLVLVDALRGELFGAVYPGGGAGNPVAGPFRIRPGKVAELVREHRAVRICGPGVARYRDVLAACCPDVERIETVRPLAEAVARIARTRFRQGCAPDLEPLYLREPDATPPGLPPFRPAGTVPPERGPAPSASRGAGHDALRRVGPAPGSRAFAPPRQRARYAFPPVFMEQSKSARFPRSRPNPVRCRWEHPKARKR